MCKAKKGKMTGFKNKLWQQFHQKVLCCQQTIEFSFLLAGCCCMCVGIFFGGGGGGVGGGCWSYVLEVNPWLSKLKLWNYSMQIMLQLSSRNHTAYRLLECSVPWCTLCWITVLNHAITVTKTMKMCIRLIEPFLQQLSFYLKMWTANSQVFAPGE